MRRAIVLATYLATSCSIVGVQPPPDHPVAGEQFDCTDDMQLPTTDFINSALLTSLTVLASVHEHEQQQPLVDPIPALGLSAILSLVSGFYGHANVTRCRALKQAAPTAPPAS
jgi:hypothetical protein